MEEASLRDVEASVDGVASEVIQLGRLLQQILNELRKANRTLERIASNTR
jgi:hypothetical protein